MTQTTRTTIPRRAGRGGRRRGRARARPAPKRRRRQRPTKKVHWSGGKRPEKPPLFSGVVSYGNLVFISGIGAHFEGDIKAHTDHVLKEIQKRLE